jgi:hypothetical protein
LALRPSPTAVMRTGNPQPDGPGAGPPGAL